ncbi:hypothetical protein TRFO_30047 [Tritrichomonas foetus]|uniref:Uncharacterized protein n=1 Tax=Tritrichomonas foetus TaxID=1144522 RepID=A0A1J4JUR4_9EUKA|nr:hypothetical protein TRFO_30047 [Tritrichomonas foetus]|eukprot:OHT02739.1 hypothetical protein TRFO_30047 [Tritrichomonas foetus]
MNVEIDITESKNHLMNDLDHLHHRILYKQRLISLLPLSSLQELPSFFPHENKEFFSFISQKPNVVADALSPKQVFWMTRICEFFLNNIKELINVTIAAVNLFETSTLTFFASSVLPSLFGYFSSHENLVLAFQFYSQVIIKLPHNQVSIILAPYFNNSCLELFINEISHEICSYFCEDVRLATSEKVNNVIFSHEKDFYESILNNYHLIPKSHTAILNALFKSGTFTKNEIFHFLVENVIFPLLKFALNSEIFAEHLKKFDLMENHFASRIDKLNLNIDKLFQPVFGCPYQIPSLFVEFGRHSLRIVTTPLDISMLVTISHSCSIEFPQSLIDITLEEYLTHQIYMPILIKVKFPNMPINTLFKGDSTFVGFDTSEKNKPPRPFENNSFHKRYCTLKNSIINKYPGLEIPDLLASNANLNPNLNLNENEKMNEKLADVSIDDKFLVECFKNEKSFDYFGICHICLNELVQNPHAQLCEACTKNRKEITFASFALNLHQNHIFKNHVDFETFLKHKVAYDRVSRWYNRISYFFNKYTHALAMNMTIRAFKDKLINLKENPKEFLNSIAHIFVNNENEKLFYCIRGEIISNIMKGKFPQEVNAVEDAWKSLTDELFEVFKQPAFSELSQKMRVFVTKIFLHSAAQLNSISLSPFKKYFFKFEAIIQDLHELDSLNNKCNHQGEGICRQDESTKRNKISDESLLSALQLANSSGLVTAFTMVDAILMRNVDFIKLLDENEIELWKSFSNAIKSIFDKNDEAKSTLETLENLIISNMDQVINSNNIF